MPRVRVACVPWRRAASSAITVSCTSGPLNGAAKTASSRSTVRSAPRTGALGIGAHLHGGALGAGNGAADEHQVLAGDELHDRQTLLGDALVAHLARQLAAGEHARRGRGRADGARGAHVVRAVGLRAGGEGVALDLALEALALGRAGDLDLLADLEGLRGHGVADQQLAGLVAELHEVADRRGGRLAQVAELRLVERLLTDGAEAELHGGVAVGVIGPDGGYGTGPGLQDGDALDAAVFLEALGHPELLGEDCGHG